MIKWQADGLVLNQLGHDGIAAAADAAGEAFLRDATVREKMI